MQFISLPQPLTCSKDTDPCRANRPFQEAAQNEPPFHEAAYAIVNAKALVL